MPFSPKGFFQNVVGFISGDKDILEGIIAGGIWMTGADGRVTRVEIDKVEENAVNDAFVSRVYTVDVIRAGMSSMTQKIKEGGLARAEKELRDLASRTEEVRFAVYLSIYRVAAVDGSVDAAERKVADTIAAILNINKDDQAKIESTVIVGGANSIVFDL